MVRRTSSASRIGVDLVAERDESLQASSENGIVMRGCSAMRATFMSKPKSTSAASTMPVIGAADG